MPKQSGVLKGGGGQGRCEQRIEVIVNMRKKAEAVGGGESGPGGGSGWM